MAILEGKKLLITGVLTDDSIAYGVAQHAIEQGAEILLTGFGRGLRLTERTAKKLSAEVQVAELDITNAEHVDNVATLITDTWGHLDGALHSIGFAPADCLGEDFFAPSWDDVSTALEVSTYSYRALADLVTPLMSNGGSIVGLTFDATVAWPAYNWMGVAKAGLESLNRYLALNLGEQNIRTNLVAAGPIKSIAAKSIPGFAEFEDAWTKRAPLGWDVTNADSVAKACAVLLSDWFDQTTGSIVHVDGGYHSVGA